MQAEEPAPGFTVLDMSDWQIIPAENLIAAFQVSCIHFVYPSPSVFARTSTSSRIALVCGMMMYIVNGMRKQPCR